MKKLIVVAILVALVGVMAVPLMASGASFVNIAITAQGSEIDISCNQTAWVVGTVHNGETKYTPDADNVTWGYFTNNGSEATDIVCHGHNMTGGTGWTMDNTTAGAATFAMQGSVTTVGDTEIHSGADAIFVSDLGITHPTHDNAFGLVFKVPTSGTGNAEMTMTIVFTGTAHV
jgi:hypothetical protein